MSLTEQKNKFKALSQWFHTAHGQVIAQCFDQELSHFKPLLHGDSLLQLGSCGDNRWFNSLRFQHKWIASELFSCENTTLCTNISRLPIDRSSVSCVIAPLTLHALSTKQNLLDEIDRILKPMGYFVLFGVNPISLWGMWIKFSRNACFGEEKGYSKSAFTIKRAMIHRGYILCHFNVFYYLPPVRSQRMITRLAMINEVGKMISPMPAGFYCLVMQKYDDKTLTPVYATDNEQFISPAATPF